MIGTPQVLLYPDPTNPTFGAPVNSNPAMTTNIQGWLAGVGSNPWTWAGGQAMAPVSVVGSAGLFRDPAYPIARDLAATAYRVRVRVTVLGPMWIIPGIFFGTTAQAAWAGPFWQPTNAISRGSWVWVPAAGTYTVEALINPGDIPAGFTFLGPNCDFFSNLTPPTLPYSIDSLELTKQAVETVDITCLLDQCEIRHGRGSPNGQPEASTITMDISADTGETLIPDSLEIGSGIGVFVSTSLIQSQRFFGRITDINYGWDDAGEDTPDALVAQVNAAGILADLGRRVVGDTPWTEELDGARVSRILAAAGITTDPTFSDPGTVQILARDVDAQAALPLAQAVADDAMGVVWETKAGVVLYADADHRRNTRSMLTLGPCDVLVSPTWTRNTEGLVNLVSIGFGLPPLDEEGNPQGEQPRYVDSSPVSQARFGRYEFVRGTQLADLAAATTLGNVVLNRNSTPVWVFSDLPLDLAGLDAERTASVLSMDVHSLVELTGLPAAGNAPTSDSLWVEGWDEILAFGVHELSLVVSGYCRTSPPPRWDDVPFELTWDTISNTITWDSAICLGPLPHSGRWDDVAATLRWDQVDISVTWDTWDQSAFRATELEAA